MGIFWTPVFTFWCVWTFSFRTYHRNTRLGTKNAEFKIFETGRRQHMKPEVLLGTSTIFSLKQEEWRIEPRSSTQQAQLFHFSTPRHSVKNGTLIGILAAHTAENDLRTFSIVLLKENYFLLLWTMRSIDRPVSGRVQPWPILLTPKIMCLILFWPLLNVSFTSSTGAENINMIRFFRSFPSRTGRLWGDPGLSK